MVVRRIAVGLAMMTLVVSCTESSRAAVPPVPGAPARSVVVSNGAISVGTPAVPIPVRELGGGDASRSNGQAGLQPSDGSLAARELAQTKPAGRSAPAAAPAKPTHTPPAARTDKVNAEPTPTPKPTMRPANIPRRDARPVFAPGRTSFVKDRGRDGVGFYRRGELTPAPPTYAQPRPPPEPVGDDADALFDEELEEATP